VSAVQHDNADIQEFDASCFSGEYVTGDITEEYLRKIEAARADPVKVSRDRLYADSPEAVEVL
jgi:amidophosphoribosyltransferase